MIYKKNPIMSRNVATGIVELTQSACRNTTPEAKGAIDLEEERKGW
jgi:hypothetical protein